MLKNMTLARWIIVFSVIGSGVLAWYGWKLREDRLVLQEALETKEVESLAQGLLVKALQHTQLYKEYQNTGAGTQENLGSFIASKAGQPEVLLGNVRIDQKEEQLRGAVDKKIRIERQNDVGVQRLQIANFLYYLENDSRRLYVTSIELTPAEKRLKEHQVPNDLWLWEAEVTVRQKREDK